MSGIEEWCWRNRGRGGCNDSQDIRGFLSSILFLLSPLGLDIAGGFLHFLIGKRALQKVTDTFSDDFGEFPLSIFLFILPGFSSLLHV